MIGRMIKMIYEEMSAAADKWLNPDGSVTTMAGDMILPADPVRAEAYQGMSPTAAKWLLPDGTIVSELPTTGGGSGGSDSGGAEKRPTLYHATSTTSSFDSMKKLTGLPDGYVLTAGDFLLVRFTNANYSTTALYLSVSGANYVVYFSGGMTGDNIYRWGAGSIAAFYFDGTRFHQIANANNTDSDSAKNGIFEQNIGDTRFRFNSENRVVGRQLVMERADGTFDGACLPPSSSLSTKPVNINADFKVGGLIWYNDSDWSPALDSIAFSKDIRMQTFRDVMFVGNALNGANHLQDCGWVYLVGIPQADPMVYRLDEASFTSWYTTDIPAAEDGKLYIRLGRISRLGTSSTWYFSLFADHPAYWFKGGSFRPYLTA